MPIRRGAGARFLLVLAGAALIVGSVQADSIVIDGTRYEDVIVYKSSTSYYVKLPKEGRVINAPLDEVDESTVQKSQDPFYRDKLHAEYERNHKRRESGEELPEQTQTESVFSAAAEEQDSGEEIDAMALLGGASGGSSGMGVSLDQAKQAAQPLGLQYSQGNAGGQPAVIGQSRDGLFRTQFIGPEDNLTAVVVSATGSQQQLAQMTPKLGALGSLAQQVAPWAGQWVQQNQNQVMGAVMSGQTLSKTQNGIKIQAGGSVDQASGTINFQFAVQGV